MNFGKIENFILFGGGTLLRRFALEIKKQNKNVFVVTSSRHAKELSSSFGKETLEEFLSKNKISFAVVDNLNDGRVTEKINSRTIGLSFGAAWIFKADFINLFKGKLLNLHGTCLPRFRGGGGYSWRIMLGDMNSCSLVHLVDPGIDTGDIVRSENYRYPESCRIPADFENYAVRKYLAFLKKFLDEVEAEKEFKLTKQDESKSTYWPRIFTDVHGFINWNWKADEADRFIRAFDDPYKGASTFIADARVRLKKCSLVRGEGSFHPFQAGIVFRKLEGAIYIALSGGALAIKEVRDEDGNDMMPKIRLGDRFYTPTSFLDEAMNFKAVYLSSGLKSR